MITTFGASINTRFFYMHVKAFAYCAVYNTTPVLFIDKEIVDLSALCSEGVRISFMTSKSGRHI